VQGARGDDVGDYFDRGLGPTRAVTVGSAASTHNTDAEGALAPGSYLVYATSPGGSDVVWVKFIPYVVGETPTAMLAAVPATPLLAGVQPFEVHIRPGHNDRVVVRATGGTAVLYLTQRSRIRKL